VKQAPALGRVRLALAAKQARRLARRQRDVEAVERDREAPADGLDHRLLARPALEETAGARGHGQRVQCGAFGRREEAPRDILRHRHHQLDVDADIARPRHGEGRHIARMAEIEEQRGAVVVERGLALSAITEPDLIGAAFPIVREDAPQARPGRDEAAPMLLEHEVARADYLVLAQDLRETRGGIVLDRKRPGPQIDRLVIHRPCPAPTAQPPSRRGNA